MILLEHLTKTYDSTSAHALRDVSLQIEDGDVFGIIGISGAGKSTLVRCINLLERPTSGRIVVDGTDVTGLRGAALRRYRRRVAMIFQAFGLLSQKTALQNVCLPILANKGNVTDKDRAHARDLLARVGLADKAGSYPSQLSGGQQQRVAIARALAMSPDVMYFDEATSALDPKLTADMHRLILELANDGMAVGIVTHEMGFARAVSDRIAFLIDGQFVEEGPAEEVIDNPKDPRTREFLLHAEG